jgi:hypothetical protein
MLRIVVCLLLTALATGAHAGPTCFDPGAGPSLRQRPQDVPCRWPLVAAPAPESPMLAPPQRGPSFRRETAALEAPPELFWRLPWHGYPPHSAPSALQWR